MRDCGNVGNTLQNVEEAFEQFEVWVTLYTVLQGYQNGPREDGIVYALLQHYAYFQDWEK